MPTETTSPIDELPPLTAASEDLTGRDRMTCNVVTSWASHCVLVIAGFIMPRYLDTRLGQEALGIWDFGWSIVSYLEFAQFGIGSAIEPYVSKYRAEGDVSGMNRAVCTGLWLQMVTSGVAGILTLTAVLAVPHLLRNGQAAHINEARWVVSLLGASAVVKLVLSVYDRVLTGCHRWDIHNFAHSGFYAATVVAMVIGLVCGGDLRILALVNLCGTILTELSRMFFAYRVCPGLRIRLGNASWAEAKAMMGFGVKTSLWSLSRVLIYQSNSLLVAAYLGPAALALFSRPKSLVNHAQVFVSKFAAVLVPTASSLHATGRENELRDLLAYATRAATFLALPPVLLLAIMGDPILALWMGTRYEQGVVLAILAIGHFAEMTRYPVTSVLTGINAHGRLGLANLGAAVLSIALGVITVGVLQWGQVGAALSVVVPLIAVNSIYMPLHISRKFGVSVRQYILRATKAPLLCAIPFALCLTSARLTWPDSPAVALSVGLATGGSVLALLYWRYAIPSVLRKKLLGALKLWLFRVHARCAAIRRRGSAADRET